MNNKAFAFTAVVLVGGLSVGTWQLLKVDSSCGSLSGDLPAGGDALEHTIAIELAGNTGEWVDEVSRFVTGQLAASGNVAPQDPLVVRAQFTRNGRTHTPASECLRHPMVLEPAEQDLEAFAEGSKETKEVMLENMRARRGSEAAIVAEEVAEEVASASFSDVDGEVIISPLPLWAAAADSDFQAAQRRVSVLSPLHSNAGDCFDQATAAVPAELSAADLVAGCVDFDQLPIIDAEVVTVDFMRALADTSSQRGAVQAMVDALCEGATTKGCTDLRTTNGDIPTTKS